jgi:hypothetical protein
LQMASRMRTKRHSSPDHTASTLEEPHNRSSIGRRGEIPSSVSVFDADNNESRKGYRRKNSSPEEHYLSGNSVMRQLIAHLFKRTTESNT